MSVELQNLRDAVSTLKAAPVYRKPDLAEKTIDSAVACIAVIDRRLSQLEERAGQHGERSQQDDR